MIPPNYDGHTKGPWRWELNLKRKHVALYGGFPKFDLTVMDFHRWGMSGAQPRFGATASPHLGMMGYARDFAEIAVGREHHSDWFQLVDHPDADLIASAPSLLAENIALKERLANAEKILQDHGLMPSSERVA